MPSTFSSQNTVLRFALLSISFFITRIPCRCSHGLLSAFVHFQPLAHAGDFGTYLVEPSRRIGVPVTALAALLLTPSPVEAAERSHIGNDLSALDVTDWLLAISVHFGRLCGAQFRNGGSYGQDKGGSVRDILFMGDCLTKDYLE